VAALGAIFVYGARGGIPWFAAFIVLTAVSAVIDPLVARDALSIPIELQTAFFGLNVGGVAVTTFAIVQYSVRQREAALSALDAEHRRSESLLLSILPAPIAARLKHGPEVIAEAHPAVTVLFADVVDFTPYAERTSPGEVVVLLDRLFSAFDGLAERHGLEKIKTIGDAYMAAAGLPEARPDHVEAAIELAIAMLAEADRCTAEGLPVRLRIGIDSGPVIAGVIGQRKFAYDLWGDTVNTASRMESSGVAGRIQVTPAVERTLRDRYAFEERAPIDVKGKGVMRPYLLVGRRMR
jgi:class 3 adenylate cyclase